MHDNRTHSLFILAVLVGLSGCGRKVETPVPVAPAPPPAIATHPDKNAYFGDLHAHTGYSIDAAPMSASALDDAYRYAKGAAVARSGGQTIQRKRPLDFLAVTDDAIENPQVMKSNWSLYAEQAAKHYEPGKFTTFIAFEWTSMPGNMNLHRTVIFGATRVPDHVFSALDSPKPEDLWTYLENARKDGSDVIAISHNDNISGGLTFADLDSYGKPIDATYAKHRRLNEIVQLKEDTFKGVHGDGLTGIWAEQNTRESLFASLKRNETFGTSGVRLRPRLFAGWNFTAEMLKSPGWIRTAYHMGVPMGSDLLQGPPGKSPTFLVAAVKDPEGANLDRIQIIKGWAKDGKSHDKIYDVALSGDRQVDPASGKAPPVGNTVAIKTATYTNSIGAAELSAFWSDPDFDPAEEAFYYVRVLEIPTPRWSTYDAAKLGIAGRKDVRATIQERAWTSAIWYNAP